MSSIGGRTRPEFQLARGINARSFMMQRVITSASLAVIATEATRAQWAGLTNQLSRPSELIAESMAHPAPGYIGAVAATCLIGNRLKTSESFRKAAIVGGVIMNFIVEGIQSWKRSSPETANIFATQNLPETTKDLCFALGGAAVLIYQKRRSTNPH